jgi:hypothetical protein
MSETAIPTTAEEAAARGLAAQSGLEYRAPGAVAVDPRALAVLPADECRRLKAVPLSASEAGALVAVADPTTARLDAVKALAGPQTRFVVIAARTLDALLRSRMFLPPAPSPQEKPAPPPEPPAPEPLPPAAGARPAPPPAAAGASPALDLRLVDAIVAALEPRLQALATPPARDLEPPPVAGAPPVAELVAQADASIAAWTSVRSSLLAFGEELDSARRNLREAKERLSVAHADNDQHQRRIHTLEAELEERQALLEETRARLQDAADALGSYAQRLESTGDVV